MKPMLFVWLTGSLLLAGCAVTAPATYQGAQSMTPAARVAVANGHADEVTCWSETTGPSSRMKHKFCATKQELADAQKADRQTLMDDAQKERQNPEKTCTGTQCR